MLLNRTNEGEVTDLEVSVSIQIKRMMIEQKAKKDLKQKYVVAQVVVPLFFPYIQLHTYIWNGSCVRFCVPPTP